MNREKIANRLYAGFAISTILSTIVCVKGLHYRDAQKNPYTNYQEVKTYNHAVKTLDGLKKKRHAILPKFDYQPKTIKEDLTVVFEAEKKKVDSLDSIIKTVEKDVKRLEATEVYQKYSTWKKDNSLATAGILGAFGSLGAIIAIGFYRLIRGK